MEDAVIEGLPEGFIVRPATPQDVDLITELTAAAELDLDGEVDVDRDDVEMGFGRAGFDASQDCIFVFEGDVPVAWADTYQDRAEADVRPSHRGLGIGSALAAWTEERARAHGEPKVSQNVTDSNRAAAELFTARGYESSRTSWYLEIAFRDGPPPEPTPPAGITIRSYDPDRDEHAVYRLIDDAFSEWEGRDPIPFEEWTAYVIRHNAFAPTMSPLAFDGDELVGAVMSFDYGEGDEGWVQQLATKATHRHRGIARALLHSAFVSFSRAGKARCGLSTDSRTGALSLYERVGMSVRRSYTRYTKRFP
jgi:ribosomal protein S18 acetylase RimI-like enzyme